MMRTRNVGSCGTFSRWRVAIKMLSLAAILEMYRNYRHSLRASTKAGIEHGDYAGRSPPSLSNDPFYQL